MEMTTMTKTNLTIVFAAAALATSVGSAMAAPAAGPNTVSTIVRYTDLDLSSKDGAKAMLHRIRKAADRVCEPEADIGDIVDYADWRHCVTTSIDSAVSRLGSPMVTAAYSGKRASQVVLAQGQTH